MYVYIYICMYIYVCIYVYMCVNMCIYVCLCVCVYYMYNYKKKTLVCYGQITLNMIKEV